MKFMLPTVIAILAAVAVACGSSDATTSTTQDTASGNPMLEYGLYIASAGPTTAQLHVTHNGSVIKANICSWAMIGAPSIDGPISGKILCSPKDGGVEAGFDTILDGAFWAGVARFEHNGAVRGGEYSCFHDESTGHYLDCFWKPGSEPPAAGSVSN